jgi:ABC-2 type transport system permease protein
VTTFAALGRRDFLLTSSYRTAVVFDVGWGTIQVLLYFFISRVVGLSPSADLGAAPSYFAFALAGILMSLIVSSATSDIGSRLREEQLTGTLELLVAQPLRGVELALGTATFPFVYAVVRVWLYLLIAVAGLGLSTSHTDWLGVVVLLVLGGLAFVGLGIAAAAVTLVFKRAAVVDAAIFAMTFVSGALFPLSVLPGWLRPIGKVMPTRPAFEGLRHALFGGGGWGLDALVLGAIAIVAIPVAVLLFDAALTHAKRRGTLAQY